jgi:hypothetical protein
MRGQTEKVGEEWEENLMKRAHACVLCEVVITLGYYAGGVRLIAGSGTAGGNVGTVVSISANRRRVV